MIPMGVDAAVGYEPDQMEGVIFRMQKAFLQNGVFRQRAVFCVAGNARQFLIHHAAGADIRMAHFGISHLAVGQTDRFP